MSILAGELRLPLKLDNRRHCYHHPSDSEREEGQMSYPDAEQPSELALEPPDPVLRRQTWSDPCPTRSEGIYHLLWLGEQVLAAK